MPYSPRNSSSLFSGLVLLILGALLLMHNYRGFELGRLFTHWWPLLIIALGLIKLYERTAGSRYVETGAARITGGEIFLIIAVLAIVGAVIAVEEGEKRFPGFVEFTGNSYPYDLEVEPKAVAPDARVTIHGSRGDISVRAGDTSEIHVSGKATVHTWSESDAARLGKKVSAEIVRNGDGYDVQPVGIKGNDPRIGVDMDVTVPAKAAVTVRNDQGDVSASDLMTPLNIFTTGKGDVDVRDSGGDVNIDSRRGDLKVSDTKGNVKLSGHGGEVDVVNASGGLTVDGEFFGPIRAEKIAKGVRFISQRTDLTLTQLNGHMELSSGNLEIADAPGNLNLRTNKYDITIENAGGKVDVQDRDASVNVRFSSLPKDDVQITNSNSSISLSLPGTSSFEIVADCHSCDISSDFDAASLKRSKSESGDAHLEGKYGSGRAAKIILKTSYGSISLHKTSLAEPPAPPEPPRSPAMPRIAPASPKAAPRDNSETD